MLVVVDEKATILFKVPLTEILERINPSLQMRLAVFATGLVNLVLSGVALGATAAAPPRQ